MKTNIRMIASATILALGINGTAYAARGDAGYPPVPAPKPTIAEPVADACSSVYDYSYQVMRSRQVGVPLQMVIDVNHYHAGQDNNVSDLFDSIAVAAYKEPRYTSQAEQERAMVDFATNVRIICMTELSN